MMPRYILRSTLLLGTGLTLVACSTTPDSSAHQDPLKNTKKLVTQGHTTLYKEGALQIPLTEIKLIPAGNDAITLAKELAGLKTKESFFKSLQAAKESVTIVSVGTKKTYEFSQEVFEGSNELADWIRAHSRPGSTQLIYNSYRHADRIMGASWETASQMAESVSETGDALSIGSISIAKKLDALGEESSQYVITDNWSRGTDMVSSSLSEANQTFEKGKDEFIKGYIQLPAQLSKRLDDMDNIKTWDNLSQNTQDLSQWRKNASDKSADMLNEVTDSYLDRVNTSLTKSKNELADSSQHGSLAVLKSLGWAMHGIVWEGVIKPIGKLTAGSLSYVAVNGVIYPIVFVGNGISSVAELAVQVSWNSAAMAYDIVAPTGHAALASVLSTTQAVSGSLVGGTMVTGGAVLSGIQYTGSKALAGTMAGAGYASGQGIKYVGVPLVSSGIVMAGGISSASVASSKALAGSTSFIAGEAAAATANVVGSGAALATLGAGTAASAAAGTGYGVYQVSKSVVIPSSYSLGSGITLGYASLSQIAAHSLLAVTDASYLVLSMEGPNWVVYSVKEAINSQKDMAPGTVLDLENMQSNGVTFERLPLSEQEMDKLIQHMPQDI